MSTNKSFRLRTSVGWLSSASIVARVLAAVAGVITARALGPEGRGVLALLLVAALIASTVATMGLDMWAARLIGGRSSYRTVRPVLDAHLLVIGPIIAAAAASAIALNLVSVAEASLTAGLIWLSTAAAVKMGALLGAHSGRRYAGAMTAGAAGYLVGVAGAVVLGYSTVVGMLVAACFGRAIVRSWPMGNLGRGEAEQQLSLASAYQSELPTMAGAVTTLALYRIDLVVVAALATTTDAGVYSVAIAVTELLWVLPNSAAQALLPRSSTTASNVENTALICRVVCTVMLLAALGVSAVSPLAVPLVFGAEFDSAWHVIPTLSVAAVAVGLWKILGHDLIGRGHARPRLSSGLFGLGVMIALDLALIPRYGIGGAAFASLMGYVTATVLVARAWCHYHDVVAPNLIIVRGADLRQIAPRKLAGSTRMAGGAERASRPQE